MNTLINKQISKEVQVRIIDLSINWILKCVEQLTDDQIWYRPNLHSNSVGNLILHLDGNVRQWLISTLHLTKDERCRQEEFDATGQRNKEELTLMLNNLSRDVSTCLPIIEEVDLTAIRKVQCYEETILSIIIHVIEHFSYHTGQITYITKMLLDIDTAYYDGQDLGQTN